jgi:hypothetical protein
MPDRPACLLHRSLSEGDPKAVARLLDELEAEYAGAEDPQILEVAPVAHILAIVRETLVELRAEPQWSGCVFRGYPVDGGSHRKNFPSQVDSLERHSTICCCSKSPIEENGHALHQRLHGQFP